ncbi:MAG: fatty acid desaturase family protein [Proteobacteria bacterium]|nr:fatty acid desaturase family protein [Pseudomonadota bacterium]
MNAGTTYLTRDDLRVLRKRSSWRGAALVLHAWGLIFGSMAMVVIWPNPLTFILAIMIIGGRQLGLAILMHDAAHGLLFPNRKVNDWVANWLCAYPVISDVTIYRPYHFTHHRNAQQDNDPDLWLSAPFPITRASFRRKTIRDLTGQTFVRQYATLFGPTADGARPQDRKPFFKNLQGPIITNLVLLAAAIASGCWWLYPTLWVLPAATWRMWVTRIRNIAEHAVVPDRGDPLRNARTTLLDLFTRLFVAPYWVNYHLEHHLYMWVPCYNLPKAHKRLVAQGLLPEMEVRHGYVGLMKEATSRPKAVALA